RIRRLVQNVGQHSHCTITMHLRQPEDGLAAHVGVGIGLRDVQQYVHRLWRRFLRDEEDSFPAKRRRALIAAREHLFKDWLGTIRIHLKKCIEAATRSSSSSSTHLEEVVLLWLAPLTAAPDACAASMAARVAVPAACAAMLAAHVASPCCASSPQIRVASVEASLLRPKSGNRCCRFARMLRAACIDADPPDRYCAKAS